MPPRDLDSEFDGESLYRALRPEWVDHETGLVRSSAITLPGCSFAREKYRTAPAAMLAARPGYTHVASVGADRLPKHVEGAPTSGLPVVAYDWVPVDDPLGDDDDGGPNDAHCQTYPCAVGGLLDRQLRVPSTVERRLKRALARSLTMIIGPAGDEARTVGPELL